MYGKKLPILLVVRKTFLIMLLDRRVVWLVTICWLNTRALVFCTKPNIHQKLFTYWTWQQIVFTLSQVLEIWPTLITSYLINLVLFVSCTKCFQYQPTAKQVWWTILTNATVVHLNRTETGANIQLQFGLRYSYFDS